MKYKTKLVWCVVNSEGRIVYSELGKKKSKKMTSLLNGKKKLCEWCHGIGLVRDMCGMCNKTGLSKYQ